MLKVRHHSDQLKGEVDLFALPDGIFQHVAWEYKFSLASSFQTLLAGILGVVNLGGALYLGNLLGQYALYGVRLPSYMGLVQQFFPFLLGYAVLFNAIPLVRKFWVQSQNTKIKARNEARRSWRAVLERKAGSVRRKLAAAGSTASCSISRERTTIPRGIRCPVERSWGRMSN